jgi:hypothetical protein
MRLTRCYQFNYNNDFGEVRPDFRDSLGFAMNWVVIALLLSKALHSLKVHNEITIKIHAWGSRLSPARQYAASCSKHSINLHLTRGLIMSHNSAARHWFKVGSLRCAGLLSYMDPARVQGLLD